jgi:hypothetical protein
VEIAIPRYPIERRGKGDVEESVSKDIGVRHFEILASKESWRSREIPNCDGSHSHSTRRIDRCPPISGIGTWKGPRIGATGIAISRYTISRSAYRVWATGELVGGQVAPYRRFGASGIGGWKFQLLMLRIAISR